MATVLQSSIWSNQMWFNLFYINSPAATVFLDTCQVNWVVFGGSKETIRVIKGLKDIWHQLLLCRTSQCSYGKLSSLYPVHFCFLMFCFKWTKSNNSGQGRRKTNACLSKFVQNCRWNWFQSTFCHYLYSALSFPLAFLFYLCFFFSCQPLFFLFLRYIHVHCSPSVGRMRGLLLVSLLHPAVNPHPFPFHWYTHTHACLNFC